MTDLAKVGSSALLSLQQAISTTGNNIANVNTEGYSRQRIEMVGLPSELERGSYVGTGVKVSSIERVYDAFLVTEVRDRTSAFESFNSYFSMSSRLTNILGDESIGLDTSLNSFFNAVQSLGNNPSGQAERQVLTSEAQSLVDRFRYLNDTLASFNNEINSRLSAGVEEINGLAASLADLNGQIIVASSNGASPNALMDRRDQVLKDLSGIVAISVYEQSDGALNVQIGSGQSLVIGSRASALQTVVSEFEPKNLDIAYAGSAGGTISSMLQGGYIGGLLTFRNEIMEPGFSQMGLTAVSLAEAMNEQHRLGVDIDGQQGGDFFSLPSLRIAAANGNAGSANIAVQVNDISQLSTSEYQLRYDGAQWEMLDVDAGTQQVVTFPITLNGLQLDLTGTAATGDRFLVQPFRDVSGSIDIALANPSKIAGAGSLNYTSISGNIGAGEIQSVTLSDATLVPLAANISLTFDENALGAGLPGLIVSGMAGGPFAFDPATDSFGKTFSFGGIEFEFAGTPEQGDQFQINNNQGVTGDNRNILAMAAIQSDQRFFNGLSTLQGLYATFVSDTAVRTNQADVGADSQQALLAGAEAAHDSTSGVNLDEEAAKLLQLQQAYQAAAQVVSIANDLFQVLINATRS